MWSRRRNGDGVLTGYRFRAELTADQVSLAEQYGGLCRLVWNTGLAQRREYRRRGVFMNYVAQAKEMADAKKEFEWLKDAPGHCLQQTLMDLDKACRRHGVFRVKYRALRRWAPSFRFPEGLKMGVEVLNRGHARVRLPKLGWVKYRASRVVAPGMIRSVTLSRRGVHWFVSMLVEDGETTPSSHVVKGVGVGIDRGVTVSIATSDGLLIDREFTTGREQRRRVILARKLSRSKRGGANNRRIRAQLAGLYARERARRIDFLAQTASQLTRHHALIVLEDLQTKNMTRRATPKPDPESPGRFLPNKAAQKTGLNKSILQKGWYQFELALQSAARYSATTIKKVPAAWTSLTCAACGHVDPINRESQAVFRCTHCHHTAHADINAAQNILAAGHSATHPACRETNPHNSELVAMKQEPAGNREGLLLQTA